MPDALSSEAQAFLARWEPAAALDASRPQRRFLADFRAGLAALLESERAFARDYAFSEALSVCRELMGPEANHERYEVAAAIFTGIKAKADPAFAAWLHSDEEGASDAD